MTTSWVRANVLASLVLTTLPLTTAMAEDNARAASLGEVARAAAAAQAVIPAGTEIKLRLREQIKSGSAKIDQRVEFVVANDVRDIAGRILIPAGSPAYGRVTESSSAGQFGKQGFLGLAIEAVRAPSGTSVPVRSSGGHGTYHAGGRSTRGAAIASGLVVGLTACVIVGAAEAASNMFSSDRSTTTNRPVAAFFAFGGLAALVWRGGEASLPAGREFTVIAAANTDIGGQSRQSP